MLAAALGWVTRTDIRAARRKSELFVGAFKNDRLKATNFLCISRSREWTFCCSLLCPARYRRIFFGSDMMIL
jgi:hypothetical protein